MDAKALQLDAIVHEKSSDQKQCWLWLHSVARDLDLFAAGYQWIHRAIDGQSGLGRRGSDRPNDPAGFACCDDFHRAVVVRFHFRKLYPAKNIDHRTSSPGLCRQSC